MPRRLFAYLRGVLEGAPFLGRRSSPEWCESREKQNKQQELNFRVSIVGADPGIITDVLSNFLVKNVFLANMCRLCTQRCGNGELIELLKAFGRCASV